MFEINVLGISGGKNGGQTSSYLKIALSELDHLGVQTKLVELTDYKLAPITRVANDPELDVPELIAATDMKELGEEIDKADGIIFATPVHWFGPSSEMKIFLDRLTPLE